MTTAAPLPTRPVDTVKPSEPFFGPVNLLTIWLALVMLIPSVLVLPGLGAFGRPANLFALGLMFWWALQRVRGGTNEHLGRQWVYVALGAYMLGHSMSYIASQLRGISADEALSSDRYMLSTIGLCGVALVAADGLRSRVEIDRVLRRALLFSAMTAFMGAVQFFTDFDLVPFLELPGLQTNGDADLSIIRDLSDFDRVSSTSGHPIEFGVVMAAILPLAVHYQMFNTDRRWKKTMSWVVLLIGLGVPISIGRSSTITLIVAMGALAFVWSKRQLAQAAFLSIIAVFALRAAQPGLVGTILSLFTGIEDDPSFTARTRDYEEAFRFIGQDPWFGRGPNTFDPTAYILLDNQILKSTIEIGYFGVIMLFTMVIIGMNLGRSVLSRGADDTSRHLGQALFASILGFTLTMFFADMLFYAQFSGLLFLFIGLAGALNRTKNQPPPGWEEPPTREYLRPSLTVAERPPDHA